MKTFVLAPLVLLALAPAPAEASSPPAGGTGAATVAPSLPAAGEPAPDFTLPSTSGRDLRLSKQRGKVVVLYFYPKDETPGCTKQACDFRDRTPDLEKAGVLVFGVSTDDLASHQRFRAKEKLPFPLLADVDGTVAKRYGVLQEKGVNGATYTGARRATFVIGKDGRILRVWPRVKVDGHVEEVLAYVTSADVRR